MRTLTILLAVWVVAAGGLGLGASAPAAERRTQNVILITFDGLRWQEMFGGADATLLNKQYGGVADTNRMQELFWRDTPAARREALLPFFWNVIARQGQLFGNTNHGSTVQVSNRIYVSYPGYSEILTGKADPRIFSNAKRPNPNVSVLEWLFLKPEFTNRVAAFCGWDVFRYILNRERSGLPVRAGFEPLATGPANPRRQLLNDLVADITPVWDSVNYDALVFHAAFDHLKEQRPRLLYIAFGETDDWAHDGRYDRVLLAARQADEYLRRIWEFVQAQPGYRDRTTLLITTDHGRGSGPVDWKEHNQRTPGSEFIWLAVLGPDTPPLGERGDTGMIWQNQVAATVAAFLDEDYHGAVPDSGPPIAEVLSR